MTRKLSDSEIGDLLIKSIVLLPQLKLGQSVPLRPLGVLSPRTHYKREINRLMRILKKNKNAKISTKLRSVSLQKLKVIAKFDNNYKPKKEKVMATKLPDSKSIEIKQLESGAYPAVCYGLAIIGTIEETFKNEKKMVKKVRLFWETPSEKYTIESQDGEVKEYTHSISKLFTFSNSTNGNLFKMLKAWSNGKIDQKLIRDFDIAKVVGMTGAISVEQKESSNKKVYTNFISISELMKGVPTPKGEREKFIFDIDEFDEETFLKLPKWVRIEVAKSSEFAELGLNIEDYIKSTAEGSEGGSEESGAWA
jgi:hypothetical protein